MFAGDRPVAVVTGAAKRVGLATARSLAAAGCDIVLTYHRSHADARTARDELASLGASVSLEQINLADPDAAHQLASRLARDLPRIDVLVHNASIYAPTPLDAIDPVEFERTYRVNALSPLILTSGLAPRLAESALAGGGAVVAMCDIHAGGESVPRRNFAAYSMSKAALYEMVRTLARELAPRIRVNAVAPGVVAWPQSGRESDESAQIAYLKRVPLGRAGSPEDAAAAVRWLALDAHYVTGQTIRVDGGRSLI